MSHLLQPDGTPLCHNNDCSYFSCGSFWRPIEAANFGFSLAGCILVTFFAISWISLRTKILISKRKMKTQGSDSLPLSVTVLVTAYERLINASYVWGLLSWIWYFMASIPETNSSYRSFLIICHFFLQFFLTSLHTFAFIYLCSDQVGVVAMSAVLRIATIWGFLYAFSSFLCFEKDVYSTVWPYTRLVSYFGHTTLYTFLLFRVYRRGATSLTATPQIPNNSIGHNGVAAFNQSNSSSKSALNRFRKIFTRKTTNFGSGFESTSLLEATRYSRPIQPFATVAICYCSLGCLSSIGVITQSSFGGCAYALEASILYILFPFALYSTLLADSKLCQNLAAREEGYRSLKRIGVGELQIDSVIGGGSGGTVVKAYYRGKLVCVKKYVVSCLHLDNLHKFEMETSMLGRLNHGNVVKVIGVCNDSPYLYLVMEYCSGGDLYSYIHNPVKVLDYTFAGIFINQIASALEYIHKNGVVHRDIKSLNVLLDEDMKIKLADFELSHYTGTIYANSTTEPGKMVGTLPWLSPEIIYDIKSDQNELSSNFWLSMLFPFRSRKKISMFEASDIYAFGVIMFELLTRKNPPLTEDQLPQILKQPVKKSFDPEKFRVTFASDGTEVPIELQNLILRCVDISPTKRPTFTEIVKILQKLEKNQP